MALVTNIPLTSANVEPLSRHEMLLWVNECLQAEFSKLEQILFSGSIQMKKVKFNSRLELDWLSNWKIVQTSWKQLGIEKVIPVEKLIKGKFQDNFEFLQWFKKFFDANYDGHPYNPMEMRNFEELPKEGKLKANSGGTALKMPQRTQLQKSRPATAAATGLMSKRVGSDASINSASGGGGAAARKAAATSAGRYATAAPPKSVTSGAARGATATTPTSTTQHFSKATTIARQPSPDTQIIEELKLKNIENEELRSQLADSDEVISGLERERDFYFAKLRKIEVLCQDNENAVGNLEVASMLQILYETEEGFAPPADDGTNGDAVGDDIGILKD